MHNKLLLFLVILTLCACERTQEERERDNAEAAIKLCWEEQAKKSNTPDMARFVAGACETMEDRFVKKYNRKP